MKLDANLEDGIVKVYGKFSDGGGPIVYCYSDGTFELFEVPQYGGYERSCGFKSSIQSALLEASSWS